MLFRFWVFPDCTFLDISNMSRSEFINQCIDYALNNLPQT